MPSTSVVLQAVLYSCYDREIQVSNPSGRRTRFLRAEIKARTHEIEVRQLNHKPPARSRPSDPTF